MVFTDSTVSSAGAHHEPEDISLIIRQLLRRSSSSSSSSSSPHAPVPPPPPLAISSSKPLILPSSFTPMGAHAGNHQLSCFSSVPIPNQHHRISGRSVVFSGSDRLAVHRIPDGTLSGVVLSSSPSYFPVSGGSNLSSESLTGSVQITSLDDHEYGEECDWESEEAPEPGVEEAETKQHPPRNQSKRSRAAEVHNMSEKRRRSRINEKMKALQNLIPNSNKTDKASMLDEAIEYLKQLQLQVQMLSLRNGLSLHPMCLPGVPGILHPAQLSQIGMDSGHSGGSLDMNMTNPHNMNTNTSDSMFTLPKQCASPGRPSLPSVSTAINSEVASFGVEPCILPNFGSFQPHDLAVCRERSVHQDHFTVKNNTETKTPGCMQQLLVPKIQN